ncbi:FAD-binding domain-containing protein [Amylostereum chailletii]|nr:FAD-binding domain-containing protein [Amylostereum chailletii]
MFVKAPVAVCLSLAATAYCKYDVVCKNISSALSSASDVYHPLSINYSQDIKHWAQSSTEQAACSVEPGTAEDVATILKIVAASRTPFAVKGGGHATNVGFSSTTGVHISMTRFANVTNNPAEGTVEVGAGLLWDDVYEALDGSGVNVVGGRVPGVGVAGFTLGGGYSWKTNQYGLTIDNIVAYELVLPNGTITTVTSADEDLWFALRGGSNNFGIVTKFTLITHPQTDVWGGLITITGDHLPKVSAAVANFSQSTDKKAAILPAYNAVVGIPGVSLILFYDGPTPPNGVFDAFLAIPHFTEDVKTRSFVDLIQSIPATNPLEGPRAAFATVSILQYTPSILSLLENATNSWGPRLALTDASSFISFDIEPFDPALFSYGTDSAYPPSRSQPLLPTNLYFSWTLPSSDNFVRGVMADITDSIRDAALAEGQDVSGAAVYGNYALPDTPLESIYGGNVAKLKAIKAAIDPENVMGLAGGFKF